MCRVNETLTGLSDRSSPAATSYTMSYSVTMARMPGAKSGGAEMIHAGFACMGLAFRTPRSLTVAFTGPSQVSSYQPLLLATDPSGLSGFGDFAMPQSRRGAVLIPKRPSCGIKPLFGVRQIQAEMCEQSSRSFALALIFVESFVEPTPWVFTGFSAEGADDFIQFAGFAIRNLVLAIDDDGQGWGLHSPERCDSAAPSAAESQGKRAGGVNAYQPICLVPASRGARQRLHLIATQSRESIPNSL